MLMKKNSKKLAFLVRSAKQAESSDGNDNHKDELGKEISI